MSWQLRWTVGHTCDEIIQAALAEQEAATANRRRPRKIGRIAHFVDTYNTREECQAFARELRRQFNDRLSYAICETIIPQPSVQLDLIDYINRQLP
jgi:hypothetical protein